MPDDYPCLVQVFYYEANNKILDCSECIIECEKKKEKENDGNET